ncbi:MAG: CARDB domain-containing protein, partial [Reyranella sp.]|nr:CARDB domain-containing protein [Reyranella sp.]
TNLDFSYVVQNSGLGSAGQTYAAFRVDQAPDTAHWISYQSVEPLAAGASETINAGFNTAGLSVGAHTLWVAADNWSYVGEGNESNNWTSVAFNVTPPPSADLVVSSVTARSVEQGTDLNFSYVVKNSGALAAGQTYAAFRVDQAPDIAHWISYNSVDPLAAGASETISASFNTADLSVGTHTLWVATDNWSYVGEGNEANNWTSTTFNVTAPGGGSSFTGATLTMIGGTPPLSVPPFITIAPYHPDDHFIV